jgi:hypothetical protein
MKKPILILLCWCLLGTLLKVLPNAEVLNNASASTDFFIPVIGAWQLHLGQTIHSPLGVGFYVPYWLIGELFGFGTKTVSETQALIFCIISLVTYWSLRKRLPGWLLALAIGCFSLFATSPVNFGDSPSIAYDSLAYDFLPMALGQIAILLAITKEQHER